MSNAVKARAHTNIALIKYWGKKNETLIIPENSSISLTLKDFYTETSVEFDDKLSSDEVIFDGKKLDYKKKSRITNLLDVVRGQAQKKAYAHVKTVNHVPTSAGLASSASGFAALAAAASKAIGLDLSKKDLSRLARHGSGSATRSIYGGFVEWNKGFGDKTSFALPLDEFPDWKLNLIAVLTDKNEKSISSSSGMKLAKTTSPYYAEWKKAANKDLKPMKKAIKNHDFTLLGRTAEENAMKMHATTLSANPAFTYFNGQTLEAINLVNDLRKKGIECYYTIDAGPNVKVIVEEKNTDKVLAAFQKHFGKENLVQTSAGPGIEYLD